MTKFFCDICGDRVGYELLFMLDIDIHINNKSPTVNIELCDNCLGSDLLGILIKKKLTDHINK